MSNGEIVRGLPTFSTWVSIVQCTILLELCGGAAHVDFIIHAHYGGQLS